MDNIYKIILIIKFIPLVISFIFLGYSCKDNNINSPRDINSDKEYKWTADTLKADDWFGMTDVWGDSPNSIWLTAFGATSKVCLWHYEGFKWTESEQELNSGLQTVFGISSDEIWIGDAYGGIWRNTGNGWIKFKEVLVSGYDRIVVESIYGISKNNLYAVGFADNYDHSGYKAMILKYDGFDWKLLNIPNIRVGLHDIKRMKNEKYMIWGSNDDNGFLDKLFIFDGDSVLKEIYSDYSQPALYEMDNDVYITINSKIYKCINDSLTLWKEFPGTSYHGTVLGNSENDFFGAGWDGILYYNGIEMTTLYQTNIDLKGYLLFPNDIIFAGYDPVKGIVIMIRGTLK